MTKPREFWIEHDGQQGEAFGIARDHNINASTRAIHVREVVPVDWEKVWSNFPIWTANEDRKRMQDLVERALKGEL